MHNFILIAAMKKGTVQYVGGEHLEEEKNGTKRTFGMEN